MARQREGKGNKSTVFGLAGKTGNRTFEQLYGLLCIHLFAVALDLRCQAIRVLAAMRVSDSPRPCRSAYRSQRYCLVDTPISDLVPVTGKSLLDGMLESDMLCAELTEPNYKGFVNALQRQSVIMDRMQGGEETSIPALSEQLGVSEMTIRRDLDKLAGSGRVRRTHGGAVPAERMAFEFDFVARRQSNRAAKQAIAAAAAELIHAGQRIILDTGTTTLELAQRLKGYQDLTVITPSLAVASELQFSDSVQTILLGGAVRKGSPDLTGIVAEAVLDMFAADIAFQGADGIGPDGAMYTADMQIAAVDQKIRTRAKETYVLADSSKFGKTALTRHGFLHDVAGLITDDGISNEDRERFETLGAKVIVVAV